MRWLYEANGKGRVKQTLPFYVAFVVVLCQVKYSFSCISEKEDFTWRNTSPVFLYSSNWCSWGLIDALLSDPLGYPVCRSLRLCWFILPVHPFKLSLSRLVSIVYYCQYTSGFCPWTKIVSRVKRYVAKYILCNPMIVKNIFRTCWTRVATRREKIYPLSMSLRGGIGVS